MSRILVIGAYGMIGAGITRHLMENGHEVMGLGRSNTLARQTFPGIGWTIRDLRDLTDAVDWKPVLEDVDYVVNCAGALQDGPADSLAMVHSTAIAALATACVAGETGLVQISAAGVSPTATTHFMRTKAAGDAAVVASGARHWILRPGLVLADTAYGGTALIRMLCAVPVVQPLALGDAQIQTIALADLARAVRACIDGDIPAGTSADLVEEVPHKLRDIVQDMRAWLGFQPARVTVVLPSMMVGFTARIADGLGRLGWRSPLRSTALTTLRDGVRGDPEPWRALNGPRIHDLHHTLANMPAHAEYRLGARMSLLMPLLVATLAVFWALSGAIGLIRAQEAAQVLTAVGWGQGAALASVVFWALVDVALAAAILWRRTAARACIGMSVVSLIYLVSATWVVPELWLNPLGPLVKVFPALVLSMVTLALVARR